MQNYNIIFHDLGFVQMFYFLVGNTLMLVIVFFSNTVYKHVKLKFTTLLYDTWIHKISKVWLVYCMRTLSIPLSGRSTCFFPGVSSPRRPGSPARSARWLSAGTVSAGPSPGHWIPEFPASHNDTSGSFRKKNNEMCIVEFHNKISLTTMKIWNIQGYKKC